MDMNGEGIEKQEINELKKNVEVLYRAEDIQDEKILNLDARVFIKNIFKISFLGVSKNRRNVTKILKNFA